MSDNHCPECQHLRQRNAELLAQLDALQTELLPLRLQVACLQKTLQAQIRWAANARLALIELADLLVEKSAGACRG